MLIDIFAILATIAGVVMGLSYIPEAVLLYKKKDSKEVSLATFSILFLGAIIWFIYGILTKEYPIITGFGISILTMGSVLFFVLKYRK